MLDIKEFRKELQRQYYPAYLSADEKLIFQSHNYDRKKHWEWVLGKIEKIPEHQVTNVKALQKSGLTNYGFQTRKQAIEHAEALFGEQLQVYPLKAYLPTTWFFVQKEFEVCFRRRESKYWHVGYSKNMAAEEYILTKQGTWQNLQEVIFEEYMQAATPKTLNQAICLFLKSKNQQMDTGLPLH